MKKITALTAFLALFFCGQARGQISPAGNTFTYDSLTAQPAVPSVHKVKVFFKNGGYYRLFANGDTKRIDSTAAPEQHIGYAWYSPTVQDSVRLFEAPQSLTVDSIRAIRTGGTSASIMVKRDRGGTMADMISANYATTTSIATPTTLQNNSLNANDVVWVIIRAISGTPTELFIQVNYH
jgi:hypothetical protein